MANIPFIAWCLEHLNYWVVTFLMAIESSFIPFPSEIVVPPAAYLSAAGNSNMNIFGIIICATAGALIGASINYAFAFFLGRPIVYKFANSRLGHLCLINQEKVEIAEQYFDKHGAIGTIVGRLIPAIRQLISIPAGLARMHFGKFLLYTAIGAGIWNTILAIIGHYLASIVTYEQLDATISEYSIYLKIAMLGLGAIVFFVLFLKEVKK